MEKRKIAIGCDHAAFTFKAALADWLIQHGFDTADCGCKDGETASYPGIAALVCQKVTSGECERGVLICGTGIGMSMAANKRHGIRAALCSDYYSAKYTRLHNDANVICFGSRVLGIELAKELLKVFLESDFEGGRHQARIAEMMAFEQEQ